MMEQKLRPKRAEDDYRYIRLGYIPREEQTDKLVAMVVQSLPGDATLPFHWKWINQESFQERHGDLGVLLWSKTSSYHLLLVSGSHVCRIWTNAKHFCLIDVLPGVAASCMSKGLKVEAIPENCLLKCKPMTERVVVETSEQMQMFIEVLIATHGLQNWVKV